MKKILTFFILLISTSVSSTEFKSNFNLEKFNLFQKDGKVVVIHSWNINNFQITYAKKGIFEEFNNKPVLVLYDGATITGKNDKITNFSFSKSDFPLSNFKSNTTTYKKTQELSSFELFKCFIFLEINKKTEDIKIENCLVQNLHNIYKELYKRFLIPIYIPLLVLIDRKSVV